MTLFVKNLLKYYNDKIVLDNISFEANSSEILTIIGDSGSGKSTLLRTLNFIEEKKDGIIILGNKNLGKFSFNRLDFGLVFQNYNLFPQYNVLDNILIPLKSKLVKEIKKDKITFFKRKKELRKRLGLKKDYIDTLINKLNIRNLLSKYPSQLSGGEGQRVAIARALVVDPLVLSFDEPTSALDPKLVNEVANLILSLKELNKIIIVVTHDITLAKKISDKVIFIQQGRIIESGNKDILNNPNSESLKKFLFN